MLNSQGFKAWLDTTDGRQSLDSYRTVLEGSIAYMAQLETENERLRVFLGKLYDEERLLGWELNEALGGE